MLAMSLSVVKVGISSAPISSALLGKSFRIYQRATTRRSLTNTGIVGSKCRRQSTVSKRDDDIDISDRVIAAVAYTLPLLDGLRYGQFFFQQFPVASYLLAPLQPLIKLFYSFPFASFLIFIALYAFVVNNSQFSRYVRFNTIQAILVDILLIIPGLIESLFRPAASGFGLQLYITYTNTIFLYVLFCYFYGVLGCLADYVDTGKVPRLPLVSQAADQQVPY